MLIKVLCSTCTNSIWCPTWTEWRCVKKNLRFTDYGFQPPVATCSYYKKRGKDFKEPRCQCEDCLKNGLLLDEEEETNG